MRLIDTTTLKLHEFHSAPEPYAILSHTWEEEEVSLQEMSLPAVVASKKGYRKIVNTCRIAKKRGYRYAWIDTCCIDKSSSAELSEAINSMYKWYQNAAVCYAYLSDISKRPMEDSRWFTRGWTLQELIAPGHVQFYDSDWDYIGSKLDIYRKLSSITGIAPSVLDGSELPSAFSVATRMSWAASRQTTRVEDMAYCLLGIFGVSMPMIYGEGAMAFRRLQEEIIKRENDLTVFAWDHIAPLIHPALESTPNSSGPDMTTVSPLLASSPAQFEKRTMPFGDDFWEFSLSNKGLVSKIRARVFIETKTKLRVYGVFLGIHQREKIVHSQITLRKIGPGLYYRWAKYPGTSSDTLRLVESSTVIAPSLPHHILVDPIASRRVPFVQFRTNAIHIAAQSGIKLQLAAPSHLWDETDRLFLKPGAYRFSGYGYDVCLFAWMKADVGDKSIRFLIVINFVEASMDDRELSPVCRIAPESKVVTDLLNRINTEVSLPFEELCSMIPEVSRWRDSAHVGVYHYMVKNTTYEISVSIKNEPIRCECAVDLIPVNNLIIKIDKK